MARTKTVLGAGARLADHLAVGYMALNCPLERVRAALQQSNAQSKRVRSLPHEVLVYYVLCMCLYRRVAYEEVLRVVIEGLREIYGEEFGGVRVNKSAITFARTRVGARPLEILYRESVKPLGLAGMQGVWYQGWRVMGLDGSTFDLPDEQANAQAFGYPKGRCGPGAFPQMRFCALSECGTHVLVGAQCDAYATSEQALARRVLASANAQMLIIADRGFMGYPMWHCALQTGAQLLFRLRHDWILPVEEALPDGSYLSSIAQTTKATKATKATETTEDTKVGDKTGKNRLRVRVIEYTLQGSNERYRLMSTLLDAAAHPAPELAALYHRRWKIETALLEIKKQLNESLSLRSKTPELVKQEFYALLIAHSAIRSMMVQAGAQTDQPPQDLSFIHAVQVLRRRLPAQAALPPCEAQSVATQRSHRNRRKEVHTISR